MSLQDQNAGNAGDQLKHALLAELLACLPQQHPWDYAETHAGAGIYPTPRAPLLRRAARAAGDGAAGAAYARLLNAWFDSDEETRYPGSPVLAALSGGIRGEMLLVEAEERSRERLRAAFDEAGPWAPAALRICAGSFEEHLPELLAGSGPLVMLADPYYYARGAADGTGGRLGCRHIAAIVAALENRNSVLLVFCSSPPESPEESTWPELAGDLAAHRPPRMRIFWAAGTPHVVLAAGWGRGADPVAGLPDANAWEGSWLAADPPGLRIGEEHLTSRGGPR